MATSYCKGAQRAQHLIERPLNSLSAFLLLFSLIGSPPAPSNSNARYLHVFCLLFTYECRYDPNPATTSRILVVVEALVRRATGLNF